MFCNCDMKKIFLSILISGLFAAGCIHIDTFEKQATIPNQKWFYNYKPSFTFTINDTTSTYNLYVVLRHTDLYRYNNIWLRIGSKAPGDSMHFQNINLLLAEDNKSWEGTGMDDVYEVRKIISPGPVSFRKSGEYTFTIGQIMRENPLEYVLNVGLRLEKVE